MTAAFAPGIIRLRLRTDGHALVPVTDAAVQSDLEIRRRFGLEDPVVLHIKTGNPRGIFNVETLKLVDRLTTAVAKLEGVREASILSLATEHSDQVFPGTLQFRRYLDPVPTTEKQLDKLRTDLLDVRLYDGNLISRDEKSTALMVGVPPEVDRVEFLEKVRALVGRIGNPSHDIKILGAPVAEALLGAHILEDLGVPDVFLRTSLLQGDEPIPWPPKSLDDAKRLLGTHVGLVPIAIAVMGVVFVLRFGSVIAAALPLVEVGACLLVVFGLMGWLGIPVYLTTTVMPVILTATGITDEIHVFSRYRSNLRSRPGEPHLDVLRLTLDEMVLPVVMASMTTAIGFLSFALSSLVPVRSFGFLTAFGIVFCMIWSLSVIPACLTLLHPRRFVGRKPTSPRTPFFARVGSFAVRRRSWVIGGGIAVVVAAPFGVRSIIVQDSWIDGFAPRSDFRCATEDFNDQFLGAHILQVCVDAGHESFHLDAGREAFDGRLFKFPFALIGDPDRLIGRRLRLTRINDDDVVGPPSRGEELRRTWSTWIQSAERKGDDVIIGGDPQHGSGQFAIRADETARVRFEFLTSPLLKPEVIRRIADLEAFLRSRTADAVGGVLGTSDYIVTVNYLSRGRKAVERIIPDNPDRIQWLWNEYERIRGADRRRQLVDDDWGRAIVTVLMKNANFVDTARLIDAARDYERRELAPHGISLSFAGDVAVSQTLIDAIVGTQIASVLGSVAGDFLITAMLGRSIIFGMLCILPSSIAILLNFAVMGWVGIPLGVATSMFSAMTLGIGVDYAIHLLDRYRALRAEGRDPKSALIEATGSTGSAISVDTMAVCLGFGVMMLSQVPANARLGALLVLSLTNCFAATMLILPAILSLRFRTPSASAGSMPTFEVGSDSPSNP